ncbi:MAG: hypothetical protein EBR52_05395 [Microbacteriaceae bacterium]|nr:hypothetical protein [Microbacteriaceae bacterium]
MSSVTAARFSWAMVLTILSIPTLAIGLVDPLEGLPALIIGIVLAIVARTTSKVKYPKLALSSFILASIMMAVILVLAIAAQVPSIVTATPTADNGLALIVLILLWVQRAVILLMVIGLVIYTVRISKARRAVVSAA